ncbi:MAG: segregation/condensation protein A [Thermoleophilia bacterium]|nr:segregation/condensation protein A [Thermoleophilia bacterium]
MTRPDPLRLPLDLDLFEGPLDLLLTLVLRDEVDLAELPVAGVVNASLGGPEPWDPATAGELIVLMAALVDLKSRRLVGDDEDDLEPDPDAAEVRELLYQRLVAYAPFQKAAAWLAEADRVAGRVHYRRAPLDGAPAFVTPGDAADLAAAMARVLREPPAPSLAHLNTARVNVSDIIHRLRAALHHDDVLSFEAQLAERDGRVIGGPLREGTTLLAALEMAHRGEVTLDQPRLFGDIAIRRAPREDPGKGAR